MESDGRGGEDGGNSNGSGENMEKSTEESAEGGLKTFAAASGKGAGENVENARTGSDGEEKSGGEEEQEAVGVGHMTKVYGFMGVRVQESGAVGSEQPGSK